MFANEGLKGVPTRKIAKQAAVSEGLIFRHFENKKGLFDAQILKAAEKANALFTPIILQTDAQKVILETIELPFSISDKEHPFWK